VLRIRSASVARWVSSAVTASAVSIASGVSDCRTSAATAASMSAPQVD